MAQLYTGLSQSFGSDFGDISSLLQDAVVEVSESIAGQYRNRLFNIGQNTAASAVNQIMSDLGIPESLQEYIQPGYTPPPPTPQWVQNAINPFIAPITDGAKSEGVKVARRLTKPLFLAGFFSILTLFAVGYMVGVSVEQGREQSSR